MYCSTTTIRCFYRKPVRYCYLRTIFLFFTLSREIFFNVIRTNTKPRNRNLTSKTLFSSLFWEMDSIRITSIYLFKTRCGKQWNYYKE